jgi:hypothetical protein
MAGELADLVTGRLSAKRRPAEPFADAPSLEEFLRGQ